MIGKVSFVILAVAVASASADSSWNCTLAFNFLASVSGQLFNNPSVLEPLAAQLNVNQSAARYGIQYILHEYYTQQGVPDAEQVVYGPCSALFEDAIQNALYANGLATSPSYSNTTSCSVDGNEITFDQSTYTLSWNAGSVNLQPAGAVIVAAMQRELQNPIYQNGDAILGNCPAAEWIAIQFFKSQIGLSYCSLNDWLFQAVDKGLNMNGLLSASVQAVIQTNPAAGQDFLASCDPQLNRLLGNFMANNAGLSNIVGSYYLRGSQVAPSVYPMKCNGSSYTFSLEDRSLALNWKSANASGKLDFTNVLSTVANVMAYPTSGNSTFGSLVNARLGQCIGWSNPWLGDWLFYTFKLMITGQN
jgi:hypothetical protein